MRTILFLIQKEFKQIFRDKILSRMMIMIPIVQLIVLVPAVTFDIKNVKVCVIDQDLSKTSRSLINKFGSSSFFIMKESSFSMEEAEDLMHKNKIDVILQIPSSFENDILREKGTKVQLIVNGINANFAQSAYAYASGIIRSFNKDIINDNITALSMSAMPNITVNTRYWYNTELAYKNYMAPGVLVILVTTIGLFIGGLNLVKEKEVGTIEQINVTPIHKYQFIAGKLIPFVLMSIVIFILGLAFAKLIYQIPINGNLFLLFGFLIVYVIAILSMGLLLSTFADSQQQYLFIVFFFIMVFILMSGIFTPEESMPGWAQKFNYINPVSYFMKVIRMILLKGSGLKNIIGELQALSVLAISLLGLSVWRYRKKA